jgi:hypothetical protein
MGNKLRPLSHVDYDGKCKSNWIFVDVRNTSAGPLVNLLSAKVSEYMVVTIIIALILILKSLFRRRNMFSKFADIFVIYLCAIMTSKFIGFKQDTHGFCGLPFGHWSTRCLGLNCSQRCNSSVGWGCSLIRRRLSSLIWLLAELSSLRATGLGALSPQWLLAASVLCHRASL